MPFEIEDEATTRLVARLAEATGVTKAGAVRRAVTPELARLVPVSEPVPLKAWFAALRARHPLPASTGLAADKAFFDELRGARRCSSMLLR